MKNCNIKKILKKVYGKGNVKEKLYNCTENGDEIEYNVSYCMSEDSNFQDYTEKGNIKYAMYCSVGDDEFSELTVVIGQNPSKSTQAGIDGTNLNILKTLLAQRQPIKQYLMLNTFPIIDPDGSNSHSDKGVDENVKYMKKLFCEFKKMYRLNRRVQRNKKFTIKIVYAFGYKLAVYRPFVKALNRIMKKMKIETVAFEYGDELQAHMSQQSCNSQSRTNREDFKLVKYNVTECKKSDFAIYEYNKCE